MLYCHSEISNSADLYKLVGSYMWNHSKEVFKNHLVSSNRDCSLAAATGLSGFEITLMKTLRMLCLNFKKIQGISLYSFAAQLQTITSTSKKAAFLT